MKAVLAAACLLCSGASAFAIEKPSSVDILIEGGVLYDGTGNPWTRRDIGIAGDRIVFIGDAAASHVSAEKRIDAKGMIVTPGFIDMHSHANPLHAEGRKMIPVITQGITTIVIGVDGDGTNEIARNFSDYGSNGVAVNVAAYVGFNAARKAVLGMSDKKPTSDEMRAMKEYVDIGMKSGALGISSGLFYTPAAYASTAEVIEVAKVSGGYSGIYDTHDRDLGAAYPGIGFLASTAEGIEIGEKSGNRVIFSHFSPQSRKNHGRANEGAALVEAARQRGVEVVAAQHPYTATNSDLNSYTLPAWAVEGGRKALAARLKDPETRRRMIGDHLAMLEIRGGPEKIKFTDPDPELNGRTLQQVTERWGVSSFETVERIALDRDISHVMNLDLYDTENIRYLAAKEWMMTCTDGYSVAQPGRVMHPRSFGAFPKKLREMVLEDGVISMAFAIRGMTGFPAQFAGFRDRGLLREGFYADINIIDPQKLRDKASYSDSQQLSEGIIYVFVNGEPVIETGKVTGALPGRPLPRD